jgi:hypothetical protein
MRYMARRSDLSGGISLRFTAAAERARELIERPLGEGRPPPLPIPGKRIRVVGDPQTSLERFLCVLDAHELLGVDGFLADDVVLVSIGDHFDYASRDDSDPRRDGLCILRWLAEHAPQQVHLLLGNHDAARVMELAAVSDAEFAKLRGVAKELVGQGSSEAARERWAELTDIPTAGLVARDYAAFTEAQRRLVIELLRAGRYRLGVAGVLAGGQAVLCTHAGITTREVELLDAGATPAALAIALDQRLRDATAARHDDWARGAITPLDLAPLHHAGRQPEEGGGLLYHRPAETVDGLRRFHPRELPPGLVQICGHTTHRKALQELRAWSTPEVVAADHGVLRTLLVDGTSIQYDVGVVAPPAGAAVLYLIDANMNEPDLDPELVPLFELTALTP